MRRQTTTSVPVRLTAPQWGEHVTIGDNNERDYLDFSESNYGPRNRDLIFEGDGIGPAFKRKQVQPVSREARCFYRISKRPDFGEWLGNAYKPEYPLALTRNQAALRGKLSSKSFGGVDLYTQLPYIAGLKLNEALPVAIEDSDDLKRRQQLEQQLDYKEYDPNSEEEETLEEPEETIVDVLGTYDSTTQRVTMYIQLIAEAAQRLGIAYQVLYEVVLAHEISHAVTHLAYDEKFGIWSDFVKASSAVKELLAQLLPCVMFRICDLPEHAEAMQKLSRHQSRRYNAYKNWCGSQVEKVWDLVESARDGSLELTFRNQRISRPKPLKSSKPRLVTAVPITLDVLQIDYQEDSVWMPRRTVIFDDGRVLSSSGHFSDLTFHNETPFVEDAFTTSTFTEHSGRVSSLTQDQLRRQARQIMKLGGTNFDVEKLIILDNTSYALKITLNGLTRIFETERDWGAQKQLFQSFITLIETARSESHSS